MLGVSRKAFVLGAPRHAACWLAAAFFFYPFFCHSRRRTPVVLFFMLFPDFHTCRLDASGRLFLCAVSPLLLLYKAVFVTPILLFI